MFTVGITTVLSVLDGTISNVALPTIAQDLSVSSAAVVWVVNAFQLAHDDAARAALDATATSAASRASTAPASPIFIVGSIACATAHSLTVLVAARIVQGIGAAGILADLAADHALRVPALRCWASRSASRA